MDDFELIISKIFELLSIEIPVFGYRFSILSIVVSFAVLSIAVGFVVKIFGGDN